MIGPVQRTSLADAVFQQILDRIVAGRFTSGEGLPSERALSEQLGVSRTAVREALVRLQQAGLVVTRHGGESRILDYRRSAGLDLLPQLVVDGGGRFHPEAARAGVEMRAAVGPDIARLCARRAPEGLLADLAATRADMERAEDDLETLQTLSMRFWDLLAEGSQNVAYQLSLNSLWQVFSRLKEPVARAMAPELRDRAGYRAIEEAVRRRAENEAEKEARAHIQLGLDPLLALIDETEPREDTPQGGAR